MALAETDSKKFVKKSIPYRSAEVFISKTELSLSSRIEEAFSVFHGYLCAKFYGREGSSSSFFVFP